LPHWRECSRRHSRIEFKISYRLRDSPWQIFLVEEKLLVSDKQRRMSLIKTILNFEESFGFLYKIASGQ